MRERISLFTNWIWEKPLLAGTPFVLDYCHMYGTSLLQTPPPVYVKIELARKETGYIYGI